MYYVRNLNGCFALAIEELTYACDFSALYEWSLELKDILRIILFARKCANVFTSSFLYKYDPQGLNMNFEVLKMILLVEFKVEAKPDRI